MIVAELVAILQRLPQNAEVVLPDEYDDETGLGDVGTVVCASFDDGGFLVEIAPLGEALSWGFMEISTDTDIAYAHPDVAALDWKYVGDRK